MVVGWLVVGWVELRWWDVTFGLGGRCSTKEGKEEVVEEKGSFYLEKRYRWEDLQLLSTSFPLARQTFGCVDSSNSACYCLCYCELAKRMGSNVRTLPVALRS